MNSRLKIPINYSLFQPPISIISAMMLYCKMPDN